MVQRCCDDENEYSFCFVSVQFSSLLSTRSQHNAIHFFLVMKSMVFSRDSRDDVKHACSIVGSGHTTCTFCSESSKVVWDQVPRQGGTVWYQAHIKHPALFHFELLSQFHTFSIGLSQLHYHTIPKWLGFGFAKDGKKYYGTIPYRSEKELMTYKYK